MCSAFPPFLRQLRLREVKQLDMSHTAAKCNWGCWMSNWTDEWKDLSLSLDSTISAGWFWINHLPLWVSVPTCIEWMQLLNIVQRAVCKRCSQNRRGTGSLLRSELALSVSGGGRTPSAPAPPVLWLKHRGRPTSWRSRARRRGRRS